MLRSLSPARSLTSKIILFFLIGSVGPMIILTYINNSFSSKNMLEITQSRVEARVSAAIERIEAYFEERRSDAQVLASLPGIREALLEKDDPKALANAMNVLDQVQTSYNYVAVSLMDTEGIIIVSTLPQLMDKNFAYRPEVKAALQGDIAISDVGAKSGEEDIYFHVTAPIRDDKGSIIGIVNVRNALDELNTMISFDTDRTGEGSYSMLLDSNLVRIITTEHTDLLYHPIVPLPASVNQQIIQEARFGGNTATFLNNATDFVETKEAIDTLNSSNQEYVFFQGRSASNAENTESMVMKMKTKDWYYLHRVPETSFYASVNAQTTYALIVMSITAVIAVTLLVVFARQTLSRPLTHLVEVAKAITAGNLDRRLTIKRQDEIGILASSFNSMAESLQSRIEAEQQAQEEAMKLQEIERATREELEHAVADYLAFTERIAQGDLSQRVTVKHNGSLGLLASGLNNMVENLHSMTRQVHDATTNIAASSAEILAATTQQASSAAEQSAAVTQITATLEEIKTIAYKTAQQAEQIARDSQEAMKIAGRGTKSVEETINGMMQIRERVESIAQTILSLSEQTQAIGAITTTVSELADQSNMLALNAAIEAARAGEQGKSFAIVAQHVRELAERSKGATGQVREILEEIQRATNAAVMVTEEGSKGVEMGVRQASAAGQVIHEIASEVENESQASVQMSAAAQQQTAGIEQIGQAMNAIQQGATQTLSSTRQAERAAQDLNKLAQSLQKVIDAYHL
jgi:methyl-accepting chemotaxis protein